MFGWHRRQTLPIPRVEVLDMRPGDTLIVEYHERLSRKDVEHIRHQFVDYLGDGTRVLVVVNASLKVLREGDPPPPPVVLSGGLDERY